MVHAGSRRLETLSQTRVRLVHDRLGKVQILHVLGDCDLTSSRALEEALSALTRDSETVIVSFLECGYIDSTCLAVLTRHQRERRTRLFVVSNPDSQCRLLLDTVRLDLTVPVCNDFREVFRRLPPAPGYHESAP